MHWQRLTVWILSSAIACAALGAWLGHELGDGRAGNVALIGATGAVLGSFVPGGVRRVLARLRDRRRPHQGAA